MPTNVSDYAIFDQVAKFNPLGRIAGRACRLTQEVLHV